MFTPTSQFFKCDQVVSKCLETTVPHGVLSVCWNTCKNNMLDVKGLLVHFNFTFVLLTVCSCHVTAYTQTKPLDVINYCCQMKILLLQKCLHFRTYKSILCLTLGIFQLCALFLIIKFSQPVKGDFMGLQVFIVIIACSKYEIFSFCMLRCSVVHASYIYEIKKPSLCSILTERGDFHLNRFAAVNLVARDTFN